MYVGICTYAWEGSLLVVHTTLQYRTHTNEFSSSSSSSRQYSIRDRHHARTVNRAKNLPIYYILHRAYVRLYVRTHYIAVTTTQVQRRFSCRTNAEQRGKKEQKHIQSRLATAAHKQNNLTTYV